MAKTNLDNSKRAKNDEFYTRHDDINNEVMEYKEKFKGAVVYCNADDPCGKRSEFWKFFYRNFREFGLKKLIATRYADRSSWRSVCFTHTFRLFLRLCDR